MTTTSNLYANNTVTTDGHDVFFQHNASKRRASLY